LNDLQASATFNRSGWRKCREGLLNRYRVLLIHGQELRHPSARPNIVGRAVQKVNSSLSALETAARKFRNYPTFKGLTLKISLTLLM
jgi:hypothetical protein